MTDGRASEALALLHTTGSVYVLVSSVFNFLVKSIYPLLAVYIASGIVGLCAAFMSNERRTEDMARFLSVVAVLGGLAATGWAFYIGLGIKGIVDPGWVIFLVTAQKLLQQTQKRRRRKKVRLRIMTIVLALVITVSIIGAPLLHVFGSTEWTVVLVYVAFVVAGTILFRQR